MDFDCLTRKELQFFCKRNKIPANITNVAMADALKALEIVEGLDEFKNQSPKISVEGLDEFKNQSPEKTMTSTRRKPRKEENQATQSTIRTRKTARKVFETPVTATNTSRRVPKAEPGIKDETPLQSCRGRTGVGSRRKVEAQKETSSQTRYCTRRSMRLLGKSMSGLSLKENEEVEPVKDDEMVEGEVVNNNGQSGGDKSELPLVRNLSSALEDEREKNDDVEEKRECNNEKNDEPEGENKFADDTDEIVDSNGSDAIAVSEDAYEIKNLKPVDDETDDVAVSQEGYEIENLEEEMVVDKSTLLVANAEASADTEAIDSVSVEENANQAPQEIECQKSLGEYCEINADEEYADDQVSQNISVLPEGHMDSSAEKRNEESDDETDDVAVSQEGYEIENLEEEMVVDKSTEVLVANAEASADTEAIDAVSVEENDNQVPQEIECQKSLGENCEINADEEYAASADTEAIDAVSVEENDNQVPQEIECQKSLGENCEINADEEYADDQVSQNVSVFPEGHMDSSAEKQNEESDDDDSFLDDSDFDDDTGSNSKSLADAQEEVSSEGPMTMVNEEALVGDDDDALGNSDIENDDEEALVDANVTGTIPVSSFHKTFQSVEENGDSETLIDDSFLDDSDFDDDTGSNSKSLADAQEEVSSEGPMTMVNEEALVGDDDDALGNSDIENDDEEALVDANVTGTIPVSSFHKTFQSVEENGDSETLIDVCVKPAEETITISSSSPLKAQLSQPRKSSSKKQTTIPRVVTQILENINKENIDNHSVKKELDLGLKKVKKNKNLEDLSLRNLKKQLTEQLSKLEISDKNKEDDTLNKQPFGKIRPALQTLSQNSMKSEESEETEIHN